MKTRLTVKEQKKKEQREKSPNLFEKLITWNRIIIECNKPILIPSLFVDFHKLMF